MKRINRKPATKKEVAAVKAAIGKACKDAGLNLTGEEALKAIMDGISAAGGKPELQRPQRFLGGSTFYGSKADFDKYSELGVRF